MDSDWRERIVDLTLDSESEDEAPSSVNPLRAPQTSTASLPRMSDLFMRPANVHATSPRKPQTRILGSGTPTGFGVSNSFSSPSGAANTTSVGRTSATGTNYVPVTLGTRNGTNDSGSSDRAEKRRRLLTGRERTLPSGLVVETNSPTVGKVVNKSQSLKTKPPSSQAHNFNLNPRSVSELKQFADNPPRHDLNKPPSTKYMNAALKNNGATTSLIQEVAGSGPRPLRIGRMPSNGQVDSPDRGVSTPRERPPLPVNPMESGQSSARGTRKTQHGDRAERKLMRPPHIIPQRDEHTDSTTMPAVANNPSFSPQQKSRCSLFAGPMSVLQDDDKDSVMSDVSIQEDILVPPQVTLGDMQPRPAPYATPMMQKSSTKATGQFSEEEEHLLIFLKEVKKFPWKLITSEFNKDYPGRVYHVLQSRYTTKTNKRDRSQDPKMLKLPPRWAREAAIDWEAVHTDAPAPRARLEHHNLQCDLAFTTEAKPRPSTVRQTTEQDYSSGTDTAVRRQRPRRAPAVNYDVRRIRRPLTDKQTETDVEDDFAPHSATIDTPVRSESLPSEHDPHTAVPAKFHVVLNEPLDMHFEALDAELGLSASKGSRSTSKQTLPYLEHSVRNLLQGPPKDWNWDQLTSRQWQGSLLHVDFSTEEHRQLQRAIRDTQITLEKSRHRTQRRHLRSVLNGLTEPKVIQLIQAIQRYLPARDRNSITAFIQDARAGLIADTPHILRLSAARPQRFARTAQIDSTTSILRQREVGSQSRRGWSTASIPLTYQVKNKIMDTLGPSAFWTGASSDIHTVAWSEDGERFAAGAVAVTDRDSMQYNRPNNLLFGSLPDATIHELAEHNIKRKRTETGANSSHAMFVSQDPELYTTVTSVAFSPSGKVMYSAGYDESICVWHLDPMSSQPILGAKLRHKAEVEIMVANRCYNGMVATAAKSAGNAVKLLTLDEDDPSKFTKHSFSSEKALSRSDLRILPQALRFEPRFGEYLLAGFGANAREGDGYDITGDLCLWDIATQTPISIHGSNRNVFDVAFNPNRRYMPLFAAGCVAGNTVNRGTRSVIRLYDEKGPDKYTCPLEIECKAFDMNDVIWCPHDEYLIAAGCTDGCVYVWDIRQPDDPLRVLSHGRSLMPLQEGIRHERTDTGVRFLSWGENATRLYSGSSDGIVKVWDVTRSEDDTFIKDLISADTGIMAGAFSPDYSKLVIGEVNGSVNVLGVGRDDCEMKDAAKLRYVPYDANDVYEDSQEDVITDLTESIASKSRLAERKHLLDTQELRLAPMGNLPIRQVVQGPNYTGPYDQSVDAPFLREQALEFQLSMATKPGPQCNITSCKDNMVKVTSEEIGDSGRSADRIPDQLRQDWTAVDASTRIMPGKTKCTHCGRPARPSSSDDPAPSILCERCAFACFRCGASNPIAAATTTLICDTCAGVWEIGALGYEAVEQPNRNYFKWDVPRLRRFGREMLADRFDDEKASFGDEVNALTDYYYSLAIDRPESPPL